MKKPVGEQELLYRDPLDSSGDELPASDDEEIAFRKRFRKLHEIQRARSPNFDFI